MIKRIILFLMCSFVFFFGLFACGNSNLYKELDFGNYKADITEAEYLGIRNKGNDINVDNELVKINQDGDIENVNFIDENNKNVDLPYIPLYIETRSSFSLIIAVHKLIYIKDSDYSWLEEDINYFVYSLLTVNDPISFMLNKEYCTMGNYITSYDREYGSPLNLIIINNKTGKVFDLSTTLFSEIPEEYGNQLYVDNISVNEDKITFLIQYYRGKYNKLIRFTYNYESDQFNREVYCPEIEKKYFTPVLTDGFNNTLFISNSQFGILKENNEEVILPEDVNFRNSEYYLFEDSIYILTFRYNEYFIDLGKINDKGKYQKLTSIEVKDIKVKEFIDLVNVNINNKFNSRYSHYKTNTLGMKVIKKNNKFLFVNVITTENIGIKSFVIDTKYNEFMFIDIVDGQTHKLFIKDKIIFINEDNVGEYNLQDYSKEILWDNLNVLNYYDNFLKFKSEYVYFDILDKNEDTNRTIYINIYTGEVYYDEIDKNEVVFKVKIDNYLFF